MTYYMQFWLVSNSACDTKKGEDTPTDRFAKGNFVISRHVRTYVTTGRSIPKMLSVDNMEH